MSQRSQFEDLRRALAAHDPEFPTLLHRLVVAPPEEQDQPIRPEAYTFDKFLQEIHTRDFHKKPADERKQYRITQMQTLEAETAEVPLPFSMRVHDLIFELWTGNDAYSRAMLLRVIAELPLVYGPWRAFKRIFKAAESSGDTEIYGALAARFDMALSRRQHGVSQITLAYLVRRAWRSLRRMGETLPACYPDTACDILAHYEDSDTDWRKTWIANHIFFHEMGNYSRDRFRFKRNPSDLLKQRAFVEAWRRTPRPLFSLLERARSEHVRKFATDALKSDFRATLREVEPAWVARLTAADSPIIHDFVVWILKNVPQFEQAKFRELGLHDAVLRLFESSSNTAQKFAAEYARTHARDLPVPFLIKLANNDADIVQKLARDLLKERDPRKDIGLAAWGELLATNGGHELAAETLRKHFTATELTPDWFVALLLSDSEYGVKFAEENFARVHAPKTLGPNFFVDLVAKSTNAEWEDDVAAFALTQLERFELDKLETEPLEQLLLHPHSRDEVVHWVDTGKLKAETFPVPFLKTVAFHPDWEASPQIAAVKQTSWGKALVFDEVLSVNVLGWLGDVRRFSPTDLTFEWLMQLVQRSESQYHDFAVETMTKAFLPADFAPKETAKPSASASPSDPITVNLSGASFLFTGKLSTMTRGEATGKVTTAGGANSSSVNAKLDYLVIGDEGSPLYGEGRKGSKQTKAEKLIEDGAAIKIISETAFLQMLVGGVREFSEDQVQAGCERLWQMLTDAGPEDTPLRKFSRRYIRRHHPDICLKETDRPVDPGAEIPPEFLTFDRVKPLFYEKRKLLREFALELAAWEFARWAPPIDGLVEMCEAPAKTVREFVSRALTIEDLPENRRFRLNPDVLTADAVYSFCESRDPATRMLGMHLIELHPRLQLPEELFRLTESPDRRVRAFVIRTFWSLYRSRGITEDWKPRPPQTATVGKKAKEKAEQAAREIGTGAPAKPEQQPASLDDLRDFLRRILYEIPPGKPDDPSGATVVTKLRPLPTRKAKLFLVETLRDLAVEDANFAAPLLPLLVEFMGSFGQSEFAASFVAVTRIQEAHPQLATVDVAEGVAS